MRKFVRLQQLLEFETCFPGEKALTPIEYLKGCDKSLILKLAAIFNTIDVRNERENDNKVILNEILCEENDSFKEYLLLKISEIENEFHNKVLIFNPYSNIKLFEIMFNQPVVEETLNHVELERNFIKAYLAINSQNTKDEDKSGKSIESLPLNLQTAMSLLCVLFPRFDKINYNKNELWVAELYKAVYLFQFLESDLRTKKLLDAFLLHFEKESWKEYLSILITITIPAILDDERKIINIEVQNGENFKRQCDFIDKLSVDYTDEFEEYDFITTRSKPLYKVENGLYRIIYKLFLIEKLFTGLYFSLNEINKCLHKSEQIKNWRSFYCKEISEKTLTYKAIENIYYGNIIKFNGQEMENMQIDGAPDYYVRKGKNILLFESKDFLIKSAKKASFDFDIYKAEFKKTLYYENNTDNSISRGAVLQIIENLKKILRNKFPLDTDYWYKDVTIYPIIITHHRDYDTNGLNVLINEWFNDELNILKSEGYFIYKIRPITIINIDTLMYYKESLLSSITLPKLIDYYVSFICKKAPKSFKSIEEQEDFYKSKTVSFAIFADNHFRDNKIHQPPTWKEMLDEALN